jgi:hypothetical protein
MAAAGEFLDFPINDGHKLRVEFFQQGDRYAHRLSAILAEGDDSRRVIPLAESVEGTPDDPWPPSPPLQSLSMEEMPVAGRAALLVGMAGRSHWSASIELELIDKNPPRFDLACRFTTVPDRLGSTYRVAPGILLQEGKGSGPIAAIFHVDSGVVASFDCVSGGWMIPANVDSKSGEFHFQVPLDKLTPPATAQWHYTIYVKKVDPAELRKRLTA